MYISGRSCKNCGKYFTPHRKHGEYCKESCRIAAYKKRHGIPIPDFDLLSKVKIQSKLQLKKSQVKSALLSAMGEYAKLELSTKSYLEQEGRYESVVNKKAEYEEYIASGRKGVMKFNVLDYELQDAAKITMIATEKLKPIRAKMMERIIEIEKLRKELEKIEHDHYIETSQTSNKLHTAATVSQKEFETLEFTGEWRKLFGKPERGFTAVIYGEKFGGKSTFALKFADYLTNFGKVIYFSAEEGVKMTMQNKLKALGINNESLKISDEQLPEAIMKTSKRFDFAVIDSLTTVGITADDLRNAKLKGANTSYIGINHITTDGRAKGGTGQLHNPDIIVKIEPIGKPIIEKNRYSEE